VAAAESRSSSGKISTDSSWRLSDTLYDTRTLSTTHGRSLWHTDALYDTRMILLTSWRWREQESMRASKKETERESAHARESAREKETACARTSAHAKKNQTDKQTDSRADRPTNKETDKIERGLRASGSPLSVNLSWRSEISEQRPTKCSIPTSIGNSFTLSRAKAKTRCSTLALLSFPVHGSETP